MALGLLGLLLHAEDAVILVELNHACALELFDGGLLMAHDAGGAFLLGKGDKLAKRKEEEVVGCHDEHIVVDAQFVHGVEEVADCAQTGFVGFRSIVYNRYGFMGFLASRW